MIGKLYNRLQALQVNDGKELSRKCAFTLAEVLIVIAIVGVVAAMTIPTLVKNWQKQSYVTALRKDIAVYSQGVKMLMDQYNVSSVLDLPMMQSGQICVSPNKWIQEECSYALADFKSIFKGATFHDEAKGYCNKSVWKDTGKSYYDRENCYKQYLTLADGSILFDGTKYRTIVGGYEDTLSLGLYIDVNGRKGPNRGGRDVFLIQILEDGYVGIIKSLSDTHVKKYCHDVPYTSNISRCAQYLMRNNWKMDY